MEDLDLDSFIANIEQTAPEDVADNSRPRCQECDILLEDVDGTYTCPNCSAQATNILELEETELHYDETGRVYLGDRAHQATKRKSKHEIDFGWTWSTDEAIVHILNLQVEALERANLVPEFFRKGLSNMWLKFWRDNIAPFIRDSYDKDDLIPLQANKALKLRDIEVLVKVKDKVMVPARLANPQKSSKKSRSHRLLGTRFVPESPLQASSSDSVGVVEVEMRDVKNDESQTGLDSMDVDELEISSTNLAHEFADPSTESLKRPLTKTLSKDSVTILTLNRTLAFLEATARCLKCRDPLFASDIIRACNSRLIPFFGAHKFLPEGLRLNPRDRLMFQKYRPVSPLQLTRAASLLIHKLYQDQAPFSTPVPSLSAILERFVYDLNLPYELTRYLRVDEGFYSIRQARPTKFFRKKIPKYFPQYDRWAFAVLICQMKRLFGLTNENIQQQARLAHKKSKRTGQKVFLLEDWIRQTSIKLKLIMTYDPFVLFHPMVSMNNLQITPQLCKYIETLLSDKPRATTRNQPIKSNEDDAIRSELADFLRRELPRPSRIESIDDEELEQTADIKHPVRDAIKRTKRFWLPKVQEQEYIVNLLFNDFSCTDLVIPKGIEKWELNVGGSITNMKFEISPDWPYCYKLLLSLGGYVCYCEPRELLREIRFIENRLYPGRRRAKRQVPSVESLSMDELDSQVDQPES